MEISGGHHRRLQEDRLIPPPITSFAGLHTANFSIYPYLYTFIYYTRYSFDSFYLSWRSIGETVSHTLDNRFSISKEHERRLVINRISNERRKKEIPNRSWNSIQSEGHFKYASVCSRKKRAINLSTIRIFDSSRVSSIPLLVPFEQIRELLITRDVSPPLQHASRQHLSRWFKRPPSPSRRKKEWGKKATRERQAAGSRVEQAISRSTEMREKRNG